MAGTPNDTLAELWRGNIDVLNDTLKVALFDNSVSYTFDPDTHATVGDVLDGGTTAQEFQGSSGYTGTADRATLQNVTVTADDANDEGEWDADDVSWSGVDGSASIQGYLIYKQVGGDDSTPGDDPILKIVDDDMPDAPAGLPLPANGSNIRISIASGGVQTISEA